MKKPTYSQLERKIKELQALSAPYLFDAFKNIDKTEAMASAVVIQITALGGREIVAPFAICDGLSPATIEALKADILKTMRMSHFETPKN